ncbi:hypothetical protein D0T12_03375 [Actinomadura spongiicola]|uniref:EthD domain-containing protein n=1 Tax=Actinomadura spongiicola TaxID=2303421 RepID=A0A372GQ61_9ACTN|nr:DUF4286 family protein [Actinomadura spongiicola]RFS87292.1 hypothetical protein D0T12_03375 [Actinomadura spongiicola]
MTRPTSAELPFSNRFLYWIALDFGSSDPADLARFNRFYDETHVPEVLARYPGFTAAHRYALQLPDERGDFGASYLAAYEVESEEAVEQYLAGTTAPEGTLPRYSNDPPLWPDLLTHRWRVVYEKVAESAPATTTPGAVYIIGIEPPPDIGDDLDEFDEFYTRVHMPEAVSIGGFSRGTRYKLRRTLEYPEPRCPRFLVVYEQPGATDEDISTTMRMLKAGTWTPGPASWPRKTTPWRLWYRHISFIPRETSPAGASARQP